MNPDTEGCMIDGWDPKHYWKRVRIQSACEPHFAFADVQSIQILQHTRLKEIMSRVSSRIRDER